MIYLIIFLSKAIEVSISTVRLVLITKGEKGIASAIGFVEVIIWLLLVGTVLSGISDDPFKGVAYALGFSFGCYLGSMLENKLAIGTMTLTVVVEESITPVVCKSLRDNSFAVTQVRASGKDNEKTMLYIGVSRKDIDKAKNIILSEVPNAMIFSSEMKSLSGGFGLRK